MSWRVVFTNRAKKDAKKLARSGLKPQAEALLGLLREDPYRTPPPFEKLVGELAAEPAPADNQLFSKIAEVCDGPAK